MLYNQSNKPYCFIKMLGIAGLLFSALAFGYNQLQQPEYRVRGDFKHFTMDQKGMLYTINQDQVIQAWNKKGREAHSINNKALGSIDALDVTNPLRIYLYYPDANTGIITDNTLSETNRIDWDALNFDQAILSCRSTERGFWLFDGDDMKLKRVTRNGETLAQSNNLYAYTDQSLEPTQLTEYGDRIYLNLPNHGIMMFDRYATYIESLRIQSIRTFDPQRHVLYYWKPDTLARHHLKQNRSEQLNLPDTTVKPVKKVRFRSHRYLIQTENSINIYPKK